MFYLATKRIEYFYCFLVILNILLNLFFINLIFQQPPLIITYIFTKLRKFPITYSYAPWNNYQTGEDVGVLGHPVHDLQQ